MGHSRLLKSENCISQKTAISASLVCCTLNLRNADHFVCLREEECVHYENLVMFFGRVHAPAVFQALVNDMLWDMLNKSVFCIFG